MSFPSFETEKQMQDVTETMNQIDPLFQYPYKQFSSELDPEEEFFSDILSEDDDVIQEVQLSPEGVPSIKGAESLGVFLDLPEVLNLSASSCSDADSSQCDLTSEIKFGKYVSGSKKTKRKHQISSKDISTSDRKSHIQEKKLKIGIKRQNNHKIAHSTSTKNKHLKCSVDGSSVQFPVRKRGRPRKYPVSTPLPLNLPIPSPSYLGLKALTDKTKNINDRIRKKQPNRLCTQCNVWFADKSTLNRHAKSQHQLQKQTQNSSDVTEISKERTKILTGWSPVDLSSTHDFSLYNLYRVKISEANYLYCAQVTQDSLFFSHPVRPGINGFVLRSDKKVLRLMGDGSDSYKVSGMDFLAVCWRSIALTSRIQFDTHALYRVRISSQPYSGCFYSTEITPYDVTISLPTQPPSYAKVDFIAKDRMKRTHIPSAPDGNPELRVAQVEKFYCFWERESSESGCLFEDAALYKSLMMSKSIHPNTYHKSDAHSPPIRSVRGESPDREKNKTGCSSSIDAYSTGKSLSISQLDSMYCHWMWTGNSSDFYENSVYRVIVRGSDGQSCNVLITTVSPLSISFTPVLPPYLPFSHRQPLVPSSYSTDSVNSVELFVEETNIPWNSVDLREKRRKFNPWRLYRVQPFNHTSQSPHRSFLCTVVRKEVLHFSDPYNNNHLGIVSFTTKNIYDSVSRTPYDNSTCVAFPLIAMHELLVSWTMIVLHSQTQFDPGYIYMAQISNQGHLFNLLSLCVAPELMLFDAPNETALIGKIHSSDKLRIVYQKASSSEEECYSVISLRILTGVVGKKSS